MCGTDTLAWHLDPLACRLEYALEAVRSMCVLAGMHCPCQHLATTYRRIFTCLEFHGTCLDTETCKIVHTKDLVLVPAYIEHEHWKGHTFHVPLTE